MEEASRTDDSSPVDTDENEATDNASSEEDSFVTFRPPESDPDDEEPEVVLWGKIGSHGASEPLAIYWSFQAEGNESFAEEGNEDFAEEENEHSPPEENGLGEENEDSPENTELLNKSFFVSLASEDVGTSEFDPSLERERFLERILSHSVNDSAVPQASIDQYKSHLCSYVNETRLDWLVDFVRNQDEHQLKNWVEPLLDQFFQEGIQYYRLNVGFAETSESIERESSETEADEQPEGTQNLEAEDHTESDSTIDVSLVTDPTSGIRAPDLRLGEEVYFRILEPAVENLPEDMIDRERSNPASVPLVGQIVGIEEKPELPKQIDGDPEDYRWISVDMDSSVRGEDLVFKENRIKVEGETGDADTDIEGDLILLGAIFGVLTVIVALILAL